MNIIDINYNFQLRALAYKTILIADYDMTNNDADYYPKRKEPHDSIVIQVYCNYNVPNISVAQGDLSLSCNLDKM
ncbi:MAG: hypothetical protein QXI16_07525 [Sulfolobaceae archaeon]